MPPTLIVDTVSSNMVLSRHLTSEGLKEYLDESGRRFTVFKWYFESGFDRKMWTRRETKRLTKKFEKERITRRLTIDITRFRRRYCPWRCDIEVHDRVLCMYPLFCYGLSADSIHDTLDLPYANRDNALASDRNELSRILTTSLREHVIETVSRFNMYTLEEIKQLFGAESPQLVEYKACLEKRASQIIHELIRIICCYWDEYYSPESFLGQVNDSFNFHFATIYRVIEMVRVTRSA